LPRDAVVRHSISVRFVDESRLSGTDRNATERSADFPS
jgi:hypothetical protein